jgi:hypothetical protein
MWRKTHIKHPNKQRKTVAVKKVIISNRHVAGLKTPPHKEAKQNWLFTVGA